MVFGPSATPGTTWNPLDKESHIVLSNGNLTATNTLGGSDVLVRSTTSKTAGKLYLECNMTSVSSEGAIGVANSSEVLTNFLGQTNNSIGIYKSGHIFLNGVNVLSGPSFVNADTVGVAIDFGGNLIWFRNTAGPTVWNAGGTADPATGIGGQSIAAITGPFFGCADVSNSTSFLTVNFGATAFAASAPTGYLAWT